MRLRRFGPLDLEVPTIGLGTWRMENDDRERAILAIRHAIDRGMVHIDTAEMYGRGAVEELVGEALAGHRGGVFLASKLRPEQATYAGTLRACEASLRRLRTDHLDLYLLHWRGTQPLRETFRAFETLKAEGKIRAWGVSNFGVEDLEEAIAIVGEGVIACNQVLYGLDDRETEEHVLPFCERHRIAFVGYSPLGAGKMPRSDVLSHLAAAHRVAPAAIALAYLVHRPGTFTIPKSSNRAHVDELAAAGDLALSEEELAAIERAFA